MSQLSHVEYQPNKQQRCDLYRAVVMRVLHTDKPRPSLIQIVNPRNK